MPSQNTLYIVFRGSTSIPDWIGNLDTILTPYPKCPDCYVHAGFYHDEQAIYNSTITSILTLQALHPTAQLVVTGHSLGAAMATLLALDILPVLEREKVSLSLTSSLTMLNFGSPRIGNENFASYASTVLADDKRYRLTHYRDVVPHLPWSKRFQHIKGTSVSLYLSLSLTDTVDIGEWYEAKDHDLKECEGYEDPTCADQWYWLSIDDHMWYLKQYLGCEAV